MNSKDSSEIIFHYDDILLMDETNIAKFFFQALMLSFR